MTSSAGTNIQVGERVIRASSRSRSRDALGTVLEAADGLLRVGFESGVDRWVHPSLLRGLGGPLCHQPLADWEIRNPIDGEPS